MVHSPPLTNMDYFQILVSRGVLLRPPPSVGELKANYGRLFHIDESLGIVLATLVLKLMAQSYTFPRHTSLSGLARILRMASQNIIYRAVAVMLCLTPSAPLAPALSPTDVAGACIHRVVIGKPNGPPDENMAYGLVSVTVAFYLPVATAAPHIYLRVGLSLLVDGTSACHHVFDVALLDVFGLVIPAASHVCAVLPQRTLPLH